MKSPQPGSARGNPSQDDRRIAGFVEATWDERIVPTLHDYIRPNSNAHGQNEFLDIPTGKRVTSCMAALLADHARRTS